MLFTAPVAHAQIGGQTAANGPFTLDNVEDRDTTAGGVLRAWVPDNVPGVGIPLMGIDPQDTTFGLTLASGQTTSGALVFRAKTNFNYINYSFGVPVPSVAGASTLTNPGNITSFKRITFLACSRPLLTNAEFQMILECYPGNAGVYPKIYWTFPAITSTTFTQVAINLRAPILITDNPSNLTVEQLLSQTRYLAFYFYSGPEPGNKTLEFFVDDIRLDDNLTAADVWQLYE